jgi:UDP-glucuronate 4-epimerase
VGFWACRHAAAVCGARAEPLTAGSRVEIVAVLVTGVAGFLGSHLAERLLADGERVIGLDNFDPFYDPARKLRHLEHALSCRAFTLVRADVRDPAGLARLPDDIEAVVHLAARPGVRGSTRDPLGYLDVNVRGTVSVLEFARRRRVRAFVFASSSAVYGPGSRLPFRETDVGDAPRSPYGVTKRSGEIFCQTYRHLYEIPVAIVRLFSVYGPRVRPDLAFWRFALALAERRPVPVYGDGTVRRDFTFVDDAIDGLVAALAYARAHPDACATVNVGRGEPVAVLDLVRALAGALGVRPRIAWRRGDPADLPATWADLSTARRVLGYGPRVSLAEGVDRFLAWFESEQRPAGARRRA